MKVTFEKSVLSNAIAPIMGAVSNKNTIAAVEGILITTSGDDGCVLTSFDLEKGFRTKVPAKVEESGSYIINGSRLNQIIRAMPDGEISISVDNHFTVKISGGKSEFELSALDGADFPSLPEFRSDIKFTINQEVFRQMILRTVFAVAHNETRAVLNGAYIVFSAEGIKIAACDGNRLALREQKCEIVSVSERQPEARFILPGKTLSELVKILKDAENTVTVSVTRRNAVFECGGLLFFSRIIEGEYLDYNKFIPTSSKVKCEIETERFIRSLERAFLVSEEKTSDNTKNYVKCTFEADMLKISSVSANGRVYDEIAVDGLDSEIQIGFDCLYLLEALRACGTEKILCGMNTPLSALVIRPYEEDETESFLYLVLPIRMKD